MSLTLEPGEIMALTGPPGAGKTTLLSVLLGFTAPNCGTVRVGGHDLRDLSPEQWRARIAWVPQHPHLFAGTIAENVRLARPEASDAQVRQALRAALALPFLAVNTLFAWRNRERTLLNGLVAVVPACGMLLVALKLGGGAVPADGWRPAVGLRDVRLPGTGSEASAPRATIRLPASTCTTLGRSARASASSTCA